MKKLTALILTAVMLVCMTAIVPVSADANIVEITAPETSYEVDAGGSVDILWDINEDLAIFNMTFAIDYDESVFTLVEYIEEEEIGSFIWEDARFKNVSYSYSFTNKNTINGLVKSIKAQDVVAGSKYQFLNTLFNVAADAPTGDYEIKFIAADASNYAGENLSVAALPSVTVHVDGVDPEPDEPAEKPAPYVAGCQVRGPVNGQKPAKFGYRFVSTVTETLKAAASELGTLVIPTELLTGDLTVDTANVAKVPAVKFMNDEGTMYNATMVEIKTKNLTKEFTAVAYAIVDGAYVYGDAYTVTISEVAEAIVADANADQALKDYVQENVLDLIG